MSNFKSIKDVFNHHITRPIDRALVTHVLQYVHNYIRKNPDHINFYGGNLLGVHRILFLPEDANIWFSEVLELDSSEVSQLQDDINDLEIPEMHDPTISKDVPRLKELNCRVSSNSVNLSFLWVIHEALVTTDLPENLKMELALTSLKMLHYKYISYLHTQRFPHLANIDISLALYESLDQKSQLKRFGTWKNLVDEICTRFLLDDSAHRKKFIVFNPDYDVIKLNNDIYTRISSIMNVLTTKFYQIKELNARITSTDKFMQVDGVAVLKSHTNDYYYIRNAIKDIVPDKNSFIREDILSVVYDVIQNASPIQVTNTLTFLSNNYTAMTKHINVSELVDEILLFTFEILRQEKIPLTHIPDIGIKMRGVLRSSRILNPEFKKIKEQLGLIIETCNPKINEVNLGSVRIAVTMYIVLRALIINKK
jgi:hypothetical protein